MTINIHENTLNIYNELRELLKSFMDESYIIYPDTGKRLRNKITGYITDSYVGVNSKDRILNFEEID